MHGFLNPNPFLQALWDAQAGLCFHCATEMILYREPNRPKGLFATKEHVFAKSTRGRGLINNVVLAHSECNNRRGAPEFPTEAEIAKTKLIYSKIGLTPFIPPRDKTLLVHNGYAINKLFNNPKLGDIWPKTPNATAKT